MDLFDESAPTVKKKRMHFSTFLIYTNEWRRSRGKGRRR
jgi:hypothetical protein